MTRRRRWALAVVAVVGLAVFVGFAVYRDRQGRRARVDPTAATSTTVASGTDVGGAGEHGGQGDGGGGKGDGGASTIPPAAVEAVIAQLRTDPPPRDAAVIAQRMGRVSAAGTPPRRLEGAAKVYREGDVETFHVHDIPNDRYLNVQARLEIVAEHAYLWVQEGQPVDRQGLEAGARAFDAEIYPKVRAVFGSEWTPGVDNDPRVHILHTEPIAGIAGFYSSADESTTAVDPNSNAREMFYVNLQTYAPGSPDYLQLLAHEFQHMIHWHEDLGEPVWVNEGLSEVAPYIAGYGRQNGAAYLADPDVSLLNWEAASGNNGPHYGASFLFFDWLRGLYGDAFLTDLVKAQGNGANGVDEALAAANARLSATPDAAGFLVRSRGCRPASFDAAFTCWAVTNVVRGVGTVGFGYPDPGIGQAEPQPLPAAGVATTVQPYGVDYWDAAPLVGADGRLSLSFEGDPTVPLLPAESSGHVWWSNSADSADSRLIRRFDLAAVAADARPTLTWRSWYALEDAWDYGYVMASTDDGATWRTVPTRMTRTDNPNGNNLGDGLTGGSGAWLDESADLAEHAGKSVDIAFEVITDDAVSLEGWAIDDIALTATGFHDDAESDGDWRREGWLRIDPVLPERWSVQVVQLGTPNAEGSTRTGCRSTRPKDRGPPTARSTSTMSIPATRSSSSSAR
ncbi:MAG: immune inhibitor A [Anaerolineae bacterium]